MSKKNSILPALLLAGVTVAGVGAAAATVLIARSKRMKEQADFDEPIDPDAQDYADEAEEPAEAEAPIALSEDAQHVELDTDGDGKVDTTLKDTNGDGVVDTVELDTDGDGRIDTIMRDTDGDGRVDTVEMDTDDDGEMDTVLTDTDGDGTLDAISSME